MEAVQEIGAITGYIDVAQVVLYVFWFFFAGLIYYLHREDRREGYPLLTHDGRPLDHGTFMPPPKIFRMADGRTAQAPSGKFDDRVLRARATEPWAGAPLQPTGDDPMLDSIGPGSYAQRADVVDVTLHGAPRIVPIRVAQDYYTPPQGPDPRGWAVVGGDGRHAGTVKDLWVDRSEHLLRYLEVDVNVPGRPARSVLLPINFALLKSWRRQVAVGVIMARHFADVPALANPDQVTLLEEDRICGYYGGGALYAKDTGREGRS